MTIVITAPDETFPEGVKVFLAGGISNCPDWQTELISIIGNVDNLILFNPRRKECPTDSESQIRWEFNRLMEADIISFWFSRGSDNPITLYELGMWGNSRETPLIVGVDPEYSRREDVRIQTKLGRPGISICGSLKDISSFIRLNVMTLGMKMRPKTKVENDNND